jgi:DNA-directed RNA polymerase subunit M/transcription elongation factor TFIIS
MKKKNLKLDYCPSCGIRMVVSAIGNNQWCHKCGYSFKLQQMKVSKEERIRKERKKKLERILK